jgi:multimeric flavodoxin WrbA
LKVIAICGSPRKNGNTEILCQHTLKSISEEGLQTELIRLSGLNILPCRACMSCLNSGVCAIEDDVEPIFIKMKDADGIILASPVYYGSCTSLLKALMERVGWLSRSHNEPFKGKSGGPLVVARRAGHNFTVAEINFWFHILGMTVPGSSYWNIAFGREPGEVIKDEEGLRTAWNFGKNLAGLLKKTQT